MNLQEIIADIQGVQTVLSSFDTWTKKVCARAADGTPVLSTDTRATCFCLLGAILRTQPNDTGRQDRLINYLTSLMPDHSKWRNVVKLTTFNDEHSYPEVMELLQRALASAQAQLTPTPGGQELDAQGNVIADGIHILPLTIPTEPSQ